MSHPLEDIAEEAEGQLSRLREMCADLADTWEKTSHGAPTFFVGKRVFAMFDRNHHGAGHVGVWLAARMEEQLMLVASEGARYYRPPYMGCKGWIGVTLAEVDDELLAYHLREAWQLIGSKQRIKGVRGTGKASPV